MSYHLKRNECIREALSALQRSCRCGKAAAAVLTLTSLFLTVPCTLHAQSRGKNKDYPYGVNQQSKRPYAIGLWGDLPYSAEQAAVIPNVIADMNAQDLAFTAHDGDLPQGSGSPSCSDGSIYTKATAYFAS